ncbi:MAG: hypothetical protein AAF583_05575 [Pseudomonadota bacterium]
MNPSFNERQIATFLKSTNNTGDWKRADFNWDNPGLVDRELSFSEQSFSMQTYSRYYKPFRELIEYIGEGSFDHLDLYRYRHSNQNEVRKLLNKLPLFKERQEKMFLRALEARKPKLVLAANAKVSRCLRDLLELAWDDKEGHHRLSSNSNDDLPVFLSGQLSGGATDSFSKQRLFWHIRQAWYA